LKESSDKTFRKLKGVLSDVFPDYRASFDRAVTADDVPGWDSTAHVGLIVEIEDRFGITFEPEEYVRFKNLGELADLIESKS
jgi:acyl carrier protein